MTYGMQVKRRPYVAIIPTSGATMGRMKDRKDRRGYWAEVCAPKLRAQKATLGGRKLPEREIASYVEAHSGKRTGRALVQTWLTGRREPYISQFFALCDKLELEPEEVLRPARGTVRRMTATMPAEFRKAAEPARAKYRVRKTRSPKDQ